MRTVAWLAVVAGVVVAALAVALSVVSPGGTRGIGTWGVVWWVALSAVVLAAWKVGRSVTAGDGIAATPWSEEARVEPAPEQGGADYPLSGERLADVVEAAGDAARSEGTVEDGFAVVRERLRPLLVSVLVQGGLAPGDADEVVRDGTWTDDRVAAAVLDGSVAPPRRSLRARLAAWLFPERVVRDRARRAVGALAVTADERLPSVVGQGAPREVPVAAPSLSELRRGADGTLQEAKNRPAGGPPDERPLAPTVQVDGDGDADDSHGTTDGDAAGSDPPADRNHDQDGGVGVEVYDEPTAAEDEGDATDRLLWESLFGSTDRTDREDRE